MTCCDLHGRNCEPPGELCCADCADCTEAGHTMGDAARGVHADGSLCSNRDLSIEAVLNRLHRLAFDPVRQAERAVRLAHYYEHECTRPWKWYCRLCGAEGEYPERVDRDWAAERHLTETVCGNGANRGHAEHGRLIHVWSYGR